MRTAGAVLALGLSGCTYCVADQCPEPPACVTRCGVELRGSVDCSLAQAREDASIVAFSRYVQGWAPSTTCAALRGAQVRLRPDAAWVDQWGRHVAGLALCETGAAEVGSEPAAYPHELAHLLECYLDGATDSTHATWTAKGVYAAIAEAARASAAP